IIQHHDIVFVEGERKADALASIGIEATCIMFGSNAPLDKVDWTPIAGKRIKIWPDRDKSGFEFAQRLVPFLLNLKCEVLLINPPEDRPEKWDAFDCIAEGGNPAEIIASAIPWTASTGDGKEQPKPRFTFEKVAQLRRLPPQQWLVKKW